MERRVRQPRRAGSRRWQWIVAVLTLALAGVLASTRSWTGPGATGAAEPLVAANVESALGRARDLASTGQQDEAVAELQSVLGALTPGADAVSQRGAALLGWELAVLARMDAATEATLSATVSAYRAIVDAPYPLEPNQVGAPIYSFDGAARLIVERLPTGLESPDAAQNSLAAAHIAALLSVGPQCASAVTDHVRLMRDRGPDALPALLRAQASSGRYFLHHDPAIRRCVAALPRERVERVLAAVAEDPGRDTLTRRSCERWLGEVADIPIGLSAQGERRDVLRDSFPEGEIVAAWRRLRDLPALDALRARLVLAHDERAVTGSILHDREVPEAEFRARSPRTEDQPLMLWVGRHTGLSRREVESGELAGWVRDEADVVALLREACGLSTHEEIDPIALLRRMDREKNARPMLHQLLSLAVPGDVQPPTWLAGSGADDIAARWRIALRVPPDALSLRLGYLELVAGRWSVVDGGHRRAAVAEAAADTKVHFAAELGPVADLHVQARVPGLGWGDDRGRRYEESQSITLWRGRDGLELHSRSSQRIVTRSSARAGGASGGRWSVPFTISPTLDLGSGSTPDLFRNQMTLLRPEPEEATAPAAADLPWDADAWRAAIATDLERLAVLAEDADPWWEFHNVHQRTLWNLSAICMTLDVPEALPPLRRLLKQAPRWNFEMSQDLLLLAALHSGASDLVEDPRVKLLAAGQSLDAMTEMTIGPGPKSWVRLWMQTDDPATRMLAESAIVRAGLTAELATDLRAALAAGSCATTPGIAAALAAVPRSQAPTLGGVLLDNAPGVAPVFALDFALVLLMGLLARGCLRGIPMPRTAAWGIALGVVATALSIEAFAVELVPRGLGLLAAAAGAWHLAAGARSRWGRVAAVAFTGGALCAWAVPAAESIFTCVAVLAMAALGRDLLASAPVRGDDAPRRAGFGASPRLLVLALLLAPLGAGLLYVLLRGMPWLPMAVLVLVALIAGTLMGVAAPRIASFDPAAPRDRWPPLFVLLYGVPIVGSHLLSLFIVLGMTETLTFSGTWVVIVLGGAGAAVLWCVGRLLDGARSMPVAVSAGERKSAASLPPPLAQ